MNYPIYSIIKGYYDMNFETTPNFLRLRRKYYVKLVPLLKIDEYIIALRTCYMTVFDVETDQLLITNYGNVYKINVRPLPL